MARLGNCDAGKYRGRGAAVRNRIRSLVALGSGIASLRKGEGAPVRAVAGIVLDALVAAPLLRTLLRVLRWKLRF